MGYNVGPTGTEQSQLVRFVGQAVAELCSYSEPG